MIRFNFILLLFLNCVAVHAQQFLTINGTIIDNQNSEPLPYASVNLKHNSYRTISNLEGRFSIQIPGTAIDDTLHISVVGYQAVDIPLKNINTREPLVVKLTMAAMMLDEVLIKDSLSTREILKLAYRKLKTNYSSKPFQMDGFYREIQKGDGQYISYIEAVSTIHSEGFSNHVGEKFKLRQLKKIQAENNPFIPFWDEKNLMLHFLFQNFVKYKSKSLLKYKEAHRLQDTSVDGVKVYVIELNERPDFWMSRIFIRADDYAIVRSEENYSNKTDGQRRWVAESNPMIEAFPQYKKLQINFKPYDGVYYPENFLMGFSALYKDRITGNTVLDFEIQQQFVVTKIMTEGLIPFAPEEILHEELSLKKMPSNFNPETWKAFTVIQETSMDSLIQKEMISNEVIRNK